jgi:hypothetical protein
MSKINRPPISISRIVKESRSQNPEVGVCFMCLKKWEGGDEKSEGEEV